MRARDSIARESLRRLGIDPHEAAGLTDWQNFDSMKSFELPDRPAPVPVMAGGNFEAALSLAALGGFAVSIGIKITGYSAPSGSVRVSISNTIWWKAGIFPPTPRVIREAPRLVGAEDPEIWRTG